MRVEAGTFATLPLLETLDLSSNGLIYVPPDIFSLANLRKLYLAENELHNLAFQNISRPIKAPLEYLNLARTEITKVPNFGIMPDLYHLNISWNSMNDIAPHQFASFCQLKEVDLNETNVEPCECEGINIFMQVELNRSPILHCKPAISMNTFTY